LGRTIGFPTANVEPDPAVVIPGSGVYAARALNRVAVVNIGMRPTVEGHHLTIEAHIDDFNGDPTAPVCDSNFSVNSVMNSALVLLSSCAEP
jgi:FAD synthase